jgi:hypothetical protein
MSLWLRRYLAFLESEPSTHPTKFGKTVVALEVVDIGGVPPVPGLGSPAFCAAAS